MNKKLLAVAVAGALAAPVVAFAQSSVTLYGNVDVAYVSKTHKTGAGGTASSTMGIGEGWQAGNRVGFRGSESLGGGMSAQFLIEQGINITNGVLFGTRAGAAGQQYDGVSPAGNMPAGAYVTGTNRQSFVGLKGGWGELLGGYQYTTLYRMSTLNGYHVGSEQPGGDLAHGTVDNGNYGGTRANGLVYNSPMIADGFQISVLRGGATGRESANFNTVQVDGKTQNNALRWSIMPTYNKGPLSLAMGYTRFKAQGNTVAANAAACPVNIFGACTAQTIAAASSVNLRSRLWQFGGSYTMGGWKFVATYASGKKDDDGVNAANVRTGADTKSKAYQGGIQFTAGAWRPFLTIGRAKTENRTAGTVAGDYKLYQFGLRYDLSKRTLLYVMHGQTKDDSATGDGAGLRKRTATALGMYMSF